MKKKLTNCIHVFGCKKLIRVMKLTVFFLLTGLLAISAESYSQAQRLNLNMKNAQIIDVFNAIEQQSEFYFFYKNDELNVKEKVDVQFQDATIDHIISRLLQGKGLTYKIVDRYIVISPDAEVSLTKQPGTKKVQGKITDPSGLPLPGVTVLIKGTTQGTITDANGDYNFPNVPDNAVLVFSFVGMKTQEIPVKDRPSVNITMEEDAIGIEEVVAVGYGTMKKSDLTGSIVSVKSSEIQKMPVSRVDQALQGKVAGMIISNEKAQPGSSPVIRIRGDNSISGDNSPLVIVDGIFDFDLNILNPSEIESVEVLKDASAKAIYGSRGSNGVLIITTKSGKSGKTRIDFNSYASFTKITGKVDLMNAEEQYTLLSTYPETGPSYSEIQDLLSLYDPDNPEGTDWQDVIFRNTLMQNYNLNISGGNNKTSFVISASHSQQEGIIKNTGYNMQSLRIKLHHRVSEKLAAGVNVYLGKTNQDNTRIDELSGATGGSATYAANQFSPILPVYDSEGNYSAMPASSTLDNPLAIITEREDELNTSSLNTTLYAEYKIVDYLKLRSSLNKKVNNSWRNRWVGKDLIEAFGIGKSIINSGYSDSWLSENTLTLDKIFMKKHHLTVMGGVTGSKYAYRSVDAASSDYPTEALKYYALELGSPESQSVNSGLTENAMLSYMGRINYIFDNKYLLTVNFRADGSSKFAKNNKWGYFPSAAFGWRISEEPFVKNQLPAINNLKLRLSYGSTGSQAISSYQSLANYNNTIIPLGESFYNAVTSSRIANPDLKWETTDESNIGLDLSLFKSRINLTADFYIKKTKDLLYSKNLPAYSGYTSQTANIGSVNNKGIELSLNTVIVENKKLRWESDFNFSLNRNKVVDLGEDEFQLYDFSGGKFGSTWYENVILQVGEPLGNFYGYLFDGIYQNESECAELPYPEGACYPGMPKFKDISGPEGVPDGRITSDDRTIMGNGLPDFVWGFSSTVMYKNFDLNILLQGVYGNEILNLNRIKLEKGGSVENKLARLLTESWNGEGTSNTVQSIDYGVGPCSSRIVEDGSYFRIKNIVLGYNFPSQLIHRLKIQSLRFYVSAQNLLTVTDYSGYDPEINSRSGNIARGIDDGGYPTCKTFTFGINLGF
jgi:TonB-linked SusC/RagA family outer membrane protein